MNLCVIPARGGSKRIPRKNIREFCGKPIIAWSIEAAKKSACFDQIVVSTDDREIAEVAIRYGATVPFLRPLELADDYSSTSSVIEHAIKWYTESFSDVSSVCCLYATAPFVRSSDLTQALALLQKTEVNRFVFTATSYPSPIQRALRLDPVSGLVRMLDPDQYGRRSQDLEPAFHDAGQFYLGRPQAWLETENLFEGSRFILLPPWLAQDIDTESDWAQAELMYKSLHQQKY